MSLNYIQALELLAENRKIRPIGALYYYFYDKEDDQVFFTLCEREFEYFPEGIDYIEISEQLKAWEEYTGE